jgi:hypothetical protein
MTTSIGHYSRNSDQWVINHRRAGVIEHLNWGYIQLGLVALAFGGLQVWWISRVFWKRNLTRTLNEGKFPKTLESIWKREQRR